MPAPNRGHRTCQGAAHLRPPPLYTVLYFPDRLDGVNRRLHGVEMDARGEWIAVRRWWLDTEGGTSR